MILSDEKIREIVFLDRVEEGVEPDVDITKKFCNGVDSFLENFVTWIFADKEKAQFRDSKWFVAIFQYDVFKTYPLNYVNRISQQGAVEKWYTSGLGIDVGGLESFIKSIGVPAPGPAALKTLMFGLAHVVDCIINDMLITHQGLIPSDHIEFTNDSHAEPPFFSLKTSEVIAKLNKFMEDHPVNTIWHPAPASNTRKPIVSNTQGNNDTHEHAHTVAEVMKLSLPSSASQLDLINKLLNGTTLDYNNIRSNARDWLHRIFEQTDINTTTPKPTKQNMFEEFIKADEYLPDNRVLFIHDVCVHLDLTDSECQAFIYAIHHHKDYRKINRETDLLMVLIRGQRPYRDRAEIQKQEHFEDYPTDIAKMAWIFDIKNSSVDDFKVVRHPEAPRMRTSVVYKKEFMVMHLTTRPVLKA